jgi:hemolysin activation/secretion protein
MISDLKKGEVLNIRKIDQITDNLSNIPTLKYKTNLDVGSSAGLTKININGIKEFPLTSSFEYDNLGQESTGRNRYSVSLRENNILGLAESLSLKYISAANAKRKESFSKAVSGSAILPFRQFRVSYNIFSSKYLTIIEGRNQDFSSSGIALMQSGALQAVLFRNSKTKITLSSGINLSDSKNYINDTLSKVQSRILSNGEVSLFGNFYTPIGAFFVKASFVKGLSILNGVKDNPNITPTSPHAQFDISKLYILYIKRINSTKAVFQTTFDGQFANTELYSQNQITVGGYYSVRGFKDFTIYGSRGYSWRNDLDFKLGDFTGAQFIKDFGFGFFADYGTASSPLNKAQKMVGAGYKISFNKGNLNANLNVAYPLNYPKYFREEIKKVNKPTLYLTTSFSI